VKALLFRLSTTLILVGLVVLYGAFTLFDPFRWKSFQGWSVSKWLALGLIVGVVALALEFLLKPMLSPALGSDRSTDPLWKRGARAAGIIVLFSILFTVIAYFKA
jgi:hypothetical protein